MLWYIVSFLSGIHSVFLVIFRNSIEQLIDTFKGLVAGCHSFCLFSCFFIIYIHSFNHNTFIRRHSLKPLSISSSPLSAQWENFPVVPSRESNSGLPYSKPTRCQLSRAAPYFILFYLILFYLILSYLILSYLILSYLILSYLIFSYLILSCLILSYLILSYLILSYLILSFYLI